VPPDALNCSL
jgi:hypothetical protein